MVDATTKPSLFGSTALTTGPAAGSFGLSTATPQPATTNFGLSGLAQQPAPTSSVFGGGAANTANNTGLTGLFGQKPAQTGLGAFGTATASGRLAGLNQSTQQAQRNATLGPTMNNQVIPGVRIDLSNLKPTTRFNDLQEDLQKDVANIDKFIENCISQKDQLDAFIPAHGEQLSAIPGDVRFISRKYHAVDSALAADLHAIKQMRDLVKNDADDAKLSFAAVDNLMLPSQYHMPGHGFFGTSTTTGSSGNADKDANDADRNLSDLIGYFLKQVDEMEEQIKKYQKNVRDIEVHLAGVQHNIMDQASRLQNDSTGLVGSSEDRLVELVAVLRDYEEGILQAAGVVGAAREGVTELQLADLRGRGLAGPY